MIHLLGQLSLYKYFKLQTITCIIIQLLLGINNSNVMLIMEICMIT